MNDLERFTREMTYTFDLLRKTVRDIPAPLGHEGKSSIHWQENPHQTGRADLYREKRGWKLVELGNGKQWLTDGINGINPDSIPLMLGALNGAISVIRYAKAHPEESLPGTEIENVLAMALDRTKKIEGGDETVG
jgi:hypothetical protein